MKTSGGSKNDRGIPETGRASASRVHGLRQRNSPRCETNRWRSHSNVPILRENNYIESRTSTVSDSKLGTLTPAKVLLTGVVPY
jgi:hypothetical protein